MLRSTLLCSLALAAPTTAQDLTPGFDYIGPTTADSDATETYNCSSRLGSAEYWLAAQPWTPTVVTRPSEFWTLYTDRGQAPSSASFTLNIHSGILAFLGDPKHGDVLHLTDVTPDLGDSSTVYNSSIDGNDNYRIGFSLPAGLTLDTESQYFFSWFAETATIQVEGPAAVPLARIAGPLGYQAWTLGNPQNNMTFAQLPYAGGPPFPGNFAMKLVGETDDPSVPFCFGDGQSGLDCPCANNSAVGAGEGCRNSTGQGVVLFASGSRAVADANLRLHARQGRPGQFGVIVAGSQPMSMPFQDGLYCMGNPTTRVERVFLDQDGFATTSVDLASASGVFAPGTTMHYQLWYSDAPHAACDGGSNLSNALSVSWN